jgi:predicted HTH domain antitoxin
MINKHNTITLERWQRQEISVREAAAELGLAYYEFLDLLADRGLPVCRGDLNTEVIEVAVECLRSEDQEDSLSD